MGPKRERTERPKPVVEFSDTELISEDDGENQEYDPPEVQEGIDGRKGPDASHVSGIRPRKGVEKHSGKVGEATAAKQTKDVSKQTQGDAIAEILRQKRTREPEVQKKLTLENVCTSIFLLQLIITLVCASVVCYCLNFYLNKTVHVSEIIDHSVDIDKEVKEAIDRKVPKVLDSRLKTLVQNEVSASFTDVTHQIDSKISEHKQGIENEFRESINILQDYKSHKESEKAKNKEVFDKFTAIGNNLDSITSEQNNVRTYIVDILHKSETAKSELNKLTEHYSSLLDTTKTDSAKIVGLQDTLQSEKLRVDNAIRELTNEQEQLKETLLQVNQLRKEYEAKVEMVNDINKRIEEIQPNVFNKEKFTIAFMILLLLVLGLAVAVILLYQRPSATADWTPPAVMMNTTNSNDILKKVPQSPQLEASVCIISFDEARTEKHRNLLDSANVPNCKIQAHVIRKHEQIADLPRCRVYLMCTEFSERHVIIEEPGKGLGDLHRTTYNAVQKLGGCLIILYTRDPGSRNLKQDSLFNRNIHCVTRQPELSDLNDDGRFFSTYDSLTQYQKTQLRNKIVQKLKDQHS